MSYLRIATHPRIFAAPLTPAEALGNILTLLALPHVRAVGEREDFLHAYQHVTANLAVRGNLVPDAHFAAILLQNGVRTLYSKDREFRKFPGLALRDPFC